MSNCNNSELPIGHPGPTGPQGIQGLQGTDGTAWLHGVGEPAPLLGVYNDYYLDTDTGDLYVKEYQGLGLRWMLTTNIYGTPGTPGTNGDNGVNGSSLVFIPYDSNFFKSLGVSDWITLDSTGPDTSFYSTVFNFLGSDLCPTDDSVAKVTLFYEASMNGDDAPFDAFANVFYNLVITTNSVSNGVVGGVIPSAYYNGTDLGNFDTTPVFTKVCYTIRRKSLTTAEVFTEWSSNREFSGSLYNAQGQYYASQFTTSGLDFNPGIYNEFKFFPSITDSEPFPSDPKARVISFYIEKLI